VYTGYKFFFSDKGKSESSAFNRIGSLNNKVRKTAAAITGIKNWGSNESVSESVSSPKLFLGLLFYISLFLLYN